MKSAALHYGAFLLLFSLVTEVAGAQDQSVAPSHTGAPASRAGAYDWFARVGLVCAAGASNSSDATKPTVQCGGVLSGPLFDLEAGVMGPQANQSNVSGYISTNFWAPLFPLERKAKSNGLPLLVGGYTRMFQTGNAFDYGVAYAYPIDDAHSLQFEARDYWAFSNPGQHNVVFRVVWLLGLPD